MAAQGSVLIQGGVVVPMTASGTLFEADVLVRDGLVSAIGHELREEGTQLLDARNALVLPGFVQTHVHVAQSLARHRAEALPLLRWLAERIWPYEAALAPQEVAAAARLGIAELLAGGTTSALDMGTTHDQDAVFEAARELGIRLISGKCHMDTGDAVPPACWRTATRLWRRRRIWARAGTGRATTRASATRVPPPPPDASRSSSRPGGTAWPM